MSGGNDGLLTRGLGCKWVLGFEVAVHWRPVSPPTPRWVAAGSCAPWPSPPAGYAGPCKGREGPDARETCTALLSQQRLYLEPGAQETRAVTALPLSLLPGFQVVTPLFGAPE